MINVACTLAVLCLGTLEDWDAAFSRCRVQLLRVNERRQQVSLKLRWYLVKSLARTPFSVLRKQFASILHWSVDRYSEFVGNR